MLKYRLQRSIGKRITLSRNLSALPAMHVSVKQKEEALREQQISNSIMVSLQAAAELSAINEISSFFME